MKNNWGKRLLSLAVAGAMALSVPLGAFAATFDLSDGDITVSAEKNDNGEEVHWVDQRDDEGNQVERDEDNATDDEKSDYKDLDVKDESGNVTAKGKGYGFKKDKEIKIEQSNQTDENSGGQTETSGETKTATDNTVTIEAKDNTTAEVTLYNINIEAKQGQNPVTEGEAAITIDADEGSTVVLELDGKNVVKSGCLHAGVEKSRSVITEADIDESGFGSNEKVLEKTPTGTLIIQDASRDGGSLEATGGMGSAGIGGAAAGAKTATANIEINGCTVVAQGGNGGAGVGGAYAGNGMSGTGTADSPEKPRNGDAENIRIINAIVTAASGNGTVSWNGNYINGAGIGGGGTGDAYGIYIENSIVKANGGSNGAGIGGGVMASDDGNLKYFRGGDCGDITIVNSNITAEGGSAGIGGASRGRVGDINIKGGNVTASAGSWGGAGIGTGHSGSLTGAITISGNAYVKASGGNYESNGISYHGAGVGTGKNGKIEEGAAIIIKDTATLVANAAGNDIASIGASADKSNRGAIRILDKAKVLLGIKDSAEEGYIGGGENTEECSAASYEVDCTATINGNEVESTYRPDMSTSEWLWDSIKTYIHYTPGSVADNNGVYTNGNLKINCVDEINAYNSGVIRSDDPIAAQRWYWVTALFNEDENVGYTYEMNGSNLLINTDEQAYGAVLHVLLSGWAEHTEVQSITFVTAGKTTTLYASEMLGITTGEQLTLTHDYDKATLAVEGRDYTYLLGEAAA